MKLGLVTSCHGWRNIGILPWNGPQLSHLKSMCAHHNCLVIQCYIIWEVETVGSFFLKHWYIIPCLIFMKLWILQYCVYVCSTWFSQRTMIGFLNSFNWLVLTVEILCLLSGGNLIVVVYYVDELQTSSS
jgi:hypothetical protein